MKFGSLDLPVRIYNSGPKLWASLLAGHLIFAQYKDVDLKVG
jgi:hypothetical protein